MDFITPDAAALAPAALGDDALLDAQRSLAASIRTLETAASRVAAEIARRSSRELGYDGLAARLGLRSGSDLVRSLSGVSMSDARKLVRVGTLVASGAVEEPWLQPALVLGVGALDAARAGLGTPTEAIPPDALGAAAAQLAAEASTLDVDGVARRARELRAELDLASVGLLEEERRQQRFLRLTLLPSGMTRLSGLLDPESAAIVTGAVDTITAPRRGGPRFVEDPEPAGLVDDRTVDQLMVDALVDVVAVAMKAPSGKLFGKRQQGVRILVTAADLASGDGAAYIEGQTEPLSVETARRHVCEVGGMALRFDEEGRGMDLGRTERFHDSRQRKVIAARHGGCAIPGCPCPPAWCEVHHIVPWSEGGGTSVEDGILLCRFHHMLIHNLGGRVVRTGTDYTLIPPRSMDPDQVPIPLPTKSRALRRLLEPALASA